MNTSPKTIRMKPATCSSRNWLRVIESPTAARQHRAGRRRRRARPRRESCDDHPPRRAGSPRRSASTDETAER